MINRSLRWIVSGVTSNLPDGVPGFIYTTVCKPRPLRAMANWVLCRMIPDSLEINGVTVALNPNDPVVSGALALGVYENHEADFFRKIARPGMVAVDIGANIGYFTSLLAHMVGERGRVIAIEPDPVNHAHLRRTISLGKLNNVSPFQVAVSNRPGTCRLFLSKNNCGDHRIYPSADRADRNRAAVDVPAVTLDSLLDENGVQKVDLIKMDIQGAETLALAGMGRTLSDNPSIILLTEFWPQGIRNAGGDPHAFLASLRKLSFEIHEFQSDTPVLLPREKDGDLIERHSGRRYTNLVCSREPLEMA